MRALDRLASGALALLLAGCGSVTAEPPASTGEGSIELTVLAASSLRPVLDDLGRRYSSSHPEVRLRSSFGASSALRAQIEQGASADLFLSADRRTAQLLADDGFAVGEAVPIARSELTLIVPADDRAQVNGLADLARPGVRLITAGSEVPISRYAENVLRRFAARAETPAGYLDHVHANVVSREESVGAVMAKIELGEGDAALVYLPDARRSSGVRLIPITTEVNVVTEHVGLVLAASERPDVATAFLAWLHTDEAMDVLKRAGFQPPP